MNDPNELYKVYAAWSGQLHFWVERQLERHIDCEFCPAPDWLFKIYSGQAEIDPGWRVANLTRPPHERSDTIRLPRPEEDPTREELDETFRAICLAAARLLRIDVSGAQLTSGNPPQRSSTSSEDVSQPRRPKRVRVRHPAKLRQPPSAKD